MRRGGKIPFLHGLTGKQALATLLVALLFGTLGSGAELLMDWRAERRTLQQSMQQTLEMVQPSAAEAAYLLNEQLAARVVTGLARYRNVEAVELRDDSGASLAQHRRRETVTSSPLATMLFGDLTDYHLPLSQEGRAVGTLTVTLSADAMAQGLLARVSYVAGMGLLRALAISAVVVLVFYLMITRPLLRLSQQVHALDPTRPGTALLPVEKGHQRDEIGVLVRTLNRLMSAFQHGLDQRDEAERGLTALTRELEDRVEQRTRALADANRKIENLNRQLRQENLRMGAELDVSRKLQQMILPNPEELTGISGLDIASYMESANEVGGDYYDILRDPDRVRITIGDVTGHGLESGVVMLMTQSAVRTMTTGAEGDLSRILRVLNRTIYDNVQRMGSDKNLTLALLDYRPHPVGGHLQIGGQHESIIVARHDGTMEVIDTLELGMPLGLLAAVEPYLGETELLLQPGDVVVLYTDGITEAANEANQLYGLERLCTVVGRHRAAPAEAIKQAVIDDLMAYIGGQVIYDDITLVVLKQQEPVQ